MGRPKTILTVPQAANRIGMSPSTLRWHCRQGILKGRALVTPGGSYRLDLATLRWFQREYERGARADMS